MDRYIGVDAHASSRTLGSSCAIRIVRIDPPDFPWLRVFVEGVVIVGSILLAFGI